MSYSARQLDLGGQRARQINDIVCGEWHSMPLQFVYTEYSVSHIRLFVPIGEHESVPGLRLLSRQAFQPPGHFWFGEHETNSLALRTLLRTWDDRICLEELAWWQLSEGCI